MKKFLLSLSFFAMTLMAGAQKPVLRADKTAVDTKSLLDALSTLTNQYEKILSELADQRAQIATIQQRMDLDLTPGTTQQHEYVDLGLPSGTLWATCNVGAEKPEDFGLYFAWGETVGYGPGTSDGKSGVIEDGREFTWASYKWMEINLKDWYGCMKYTFADNRTNGCWYSGSTYVGTTIVDKTYKNLTKLEAEDDAATANWGSDWRMPTHAEQEELLNYCTWEWTTVNGVNGYKVTNKVPGYDGKSIFLPAAGSRYDNRYSNMGTDGFYWSSELYEGNSSEAYNMYYIDKDKASWLWINRHYGFPVRPVFQKK